MYLYSESYGGKMAAQFALALHRAQEQHEIYLSFRSGFMQHCHLLRQLRIVTPVHQPFGRCYGSAGNNELLGVGSLLVVPSGRPFAGCLAR